MAAVWLPDPQKEVFAEDEVTISILAQTLQQGFFKVSLNNDGYLTVYTDGPRVIMGSLGSAVVSEFWPNKTMV
jgi:hypothetical protein